MPVLEGVMDVMSAVTFIQFIEEEAIQACQLGCYLALRYRAFKAASWSITTTRGTLLPHLKAINDHIGWLAPYSKGAFADFVTAVETNLIVYDELLLAARGEKKKSY